MNSSAVFCAGYAFLLFQDESSVQALIDACIEEDGKLYLCVSSPTIKDKPVSGNTHKRTLICSHLLTSPADFKLCAQCNLFLELKTCWFCVWQVQIRPWNLNDSDFVMDGSQPLDPRKTIFVGGVPRPLRAGVLHFYVCLFMALSPPPTRWINNTWAFTMTTLTFEVYSVHTGWILCVCYCLFPVFSVIHQRPLKCSQCRCFCVPYVRLSINTSLHLSFCTCLSCKSQISNTK